MTPQEQEMIGDLIDRVRKTQLAEKDMDAEQMLQEGLGRNPDALYILAQTVLVQKYALEQAQAQLAQLKAQAQHPEPRHATSFLGSLLGRNDASPPPPPQSYPPPPPQTYPQYGAPMGVGGGGGFLQGAMQTAAGVAAGALAFEGIESLMHGFGHAAGYGQGFGGFDGGQRPAEEVVNNYYGEERGGHQVSDAAQMEGDRESRDFGGNRDDRGSQSGSGDLDDRGASDFADTSSVDDGGASLDDGGANDSNDTSSFDDGGGGFDDGGSGGGDDGSFA